MAAKEDLQAIEAVKQTAKLFAPLVAIAQHADRFSALVNHEDELIRSIADKQNELAQLKAAHAAELAAHEGVAQAAEVDHARCMKEYADRRTAANAEASQAEADSKQKIAESKARAERASNKADKDVADAEAQAATAKHDVQQETMRFEAEHAAKRAAIEAQTAALQQKLDELRAQVAPLMVDTAAPAGQD